MKMEYLNLIVATFAAVIAFVTWFTSRQHNRSSVRPAICSRLHTNSRSYSLKIANKGHGSADILSFDYFFRGHKVSRDRLANILTEEASRRGAIKGHEFGDFTPGSYISKDEDFLCIFLEFSEDMDVDSLAEFIKRNFRLEIHYQSVYKQKFTFDSIRHI